jgi:hypothetical protein
MKTKLKIKTKTKIPDEARIKTVTETRTKTMMKKATAAGLVVDPKMKIKSEERKAGWKMETLDSGTPKPKPHRSSERTRRS